MVHVLGPFVSGGHYIEQFEFFEQLSREDAHAYMALYRHDGAAHLGELSSLLADDGVVLDFTAKSVRVAFEALARRMATVKTTPDDELPEWMKTSDQYPLGIYDFSDESQVLIRWLSYYFAATLIRVVRADLRWDLGDPRTILQNQPVLEGFRDGVEMSPLLVTENLLRRLVERPDPSTADDVDTAVATWCRHADGLTTER